MLPLLNTPMTAGRGRNEITAARAARDIVEGLEQERDETYVGKARALCILHRLLPSVAATMLQDA